jgi:excisionase family DNA binding protein
MASKQNGQTNPTAPVVASDFSGGAFNIMQAAAYSGVRCSAVEEAIRDGRLPGRRLGRNIIILKPDLDSFLASLEIIPAHTPPSILRRWQERKTA